MGLDLLQERAKARLSLAELRSQRQQLHQLTNRLRAALNNPEPQLASKLIRDLIADGLLP